MGSVTERVDSLIAAGDLDSVAGVCDEFEIVAGGAGNVPEWPHATHVLSRMLAGDLERAAELRYGKLVELENEIADKQKELETLQAQGSVLSEEVTSEDLGGASVHAERSGVCHFTHPDDKTSLNAVRRLLSYLPLNNAEDPPFVPSEDPADRQDVSLDSLVPEDPQKPYDMRDVITRIVDQGSWFEVQEAFARNILCGFARLGGRVVGIVANQPAVLAGCLDIAASEKAARFIRFCDAFNVPIVTFEDVPGFLPGTAQEYAGIIRHGAKLLYAYCEATVPKVTVITRKAYGGAYDVMASKHVRADLNVAWPGAQIAVMGAAGAPTVRQLGCAPVSEGGVVGQDRQTGFKVGGEARLVLDHHGKWQIERGCFRRRSRPSHLCPGRIDEAGVNVHQHGRLEVGLVHLQGRQRPRLKPGQGQAVLILDQEMQAELITAVVEVGEAL